MYLINFTAQVTNFPCIWYYGSQLNKLYTLFPAGVFPPDSLIDMPESANVATV